MFLFTALSINQELIDTELDIIWYTILLFGIINVILILRLFYQSQSKKITTGYFKTKTMPFRPDFTTQRTLTTKEKPLMKEQTNHFESFLKIILFDEERIFFTQTDILKFLKITDKNYYQKRQYIQNFLNGIEQYISLTGNCHPPLSKGRNKKDNREIFYYINPTYIEIFSKIHS